MIYGHPGPFDENVVSGGVRLLGFIMPDLGINILYCDLGIVEGCAGVAPEKGENPNYIYRGTFCHCEG